MKLTVGRFDREGLQFCSWWRPLRSKCPTINFLFATWIAQLPQRGVPWLHVIQVSDPTMNSPLPLSMTMSLSSLSPLQEPSCFLNWGPLHRQNRTHVFLRLKHAHHASCWIQGPLLSCQYCCSVLKRVLDVKAIVLLMPLDFLCERTAPRP